MRGGNVPTVRGNGWKYLLFGSHLDAFNSLLLNSGLYVCHVFEQKANLTNSSVWKTGETGDIHYLLILHEILIHRKQILINYDFV